MAAASDPLANEGGLQGFKPLLAALATICLAVLGCFLASSVGSISYGGPGAIVGGVGGFFVFGGLACCLTGFLKEVLSWYLPNVHSLVPSAAAFAVGKHGTFDLIVTIHELQNLRVLGRIVGGGDLYVTATVGDNPPKSTCVKQNRVWNEQFRLKIKPSDDTILIRVLDQDFFGSTALGYTAIEISHILKKPLLGKGKDEYPLTLKQGKAAPRGDGQKAQIVLSFDPAHGFPPSAQNDMGGDWGEKYKDREAQSKTQMGDYFAKIGEQQPGYGALNTQFTRSERLPKQHHMEQP